MKRSGFNSFQSKSAASYGINNPIDSFGSIKNAILSVLNTTDAQIFTSLETKYIVADSAGIISRWNPTHAPSANLHFTQSTLTNMMSYDNTYKLGKGGGLRGTTDDWYYQESSESTSSANKSYMLYYRQVSAGGTAAPDYPIIHSNYGTNVFGQAELKSSLNLRTYNSTAVRLAVGLQPSNKFANGVQTIAAGTIINTTSNLFRVFRASINTQRTASLTAQDENFNYFGSFASSVGISSSFSSSITYTPVSIGTYTDASWDLNFPGNRFGASKFFIGASSLGGDKTYFGLIYVPADITSAQAIQVKYLLDKAYGVV